MMENRIVLRNLTGEQIIVQRSVKMYEKYGISVIDTFEEMLKTLMLPEQCFSWKKVRFLAPDFFYVLDTEDIKREYHLVETSQTYVLTHIVVGGEDTPYEHQRYSISHLPDFLTEYYKALQNAHLVRSEPLKKLRGNVEFETQTDLDCFEKQSFFKNTKDLEILISVLLKEDLSPYLVTSDNSELIVMTAQDRKRFCFKILDAETIEIQKGFEPVRVLYKINSTTAVLYQPQKQNKTF